MSILQIILEMSLAEVTFVKAKDEGESTRFLVILRRNVP